MTNNFKTDKSGKDSSAKEGPGKDQSEKVRPGVGRTEKDQSVKDQSGKDRSGKDRSGKDRSENARPENDESAQYASPACFLHELDPGMRLASAEPVWDKVKDWRKQQRNRLIAIRDSLDQSQHAASSQSVADQLQQSGWLGNYNSISFFWPMQGEIDLRPLITELVKQGITAVLPVITQRNQPLEFWQWTPGEALSSEGLWGIPIPAVRRPVDPELLLVPMLGFDDQGHRMGFGGGYYDRSIAAMQPPPVCIGVCCDYGHMHSIYPQAHDMPMHAIASESQFRIFKKPETFD